MVEQRTTEEIKRIGICEPFLISGLLPTLAPAILKSTLEQEQYQARIFYPSICFFIKNHIDRNTSFLHLTEDIPLQICDYLFLEPEGNLRSFYEKTLPSTYISEDVLDNLVFLRNKAQDVLDEMTEEMISFHPDVFLFSLTFGGYAFAKILFRRIKSLFPDIIMIVGGSSCVPEICDDIMHMLPETDFIICDESPEHLPELLKCLQEGKSDFPSCVYSREKRAEEYAVIDSLDRLPYPDFGDFLDTVHRFGIQNDQITLPFETARGCWWGEMHPCKMCGFFGERKHYLAKSSSRIIEELQTIKDKYNISKFRISDLVQPKKELLEKLLPLSKMDIRLFWEIRPDVTEKEFALLRALGVTYSQIGFESLSSDFLKLIRKGTTGIHNVEVLIWARTYKIDLFWNYLYGIEQDKPEWYNDVLSILPLLYHLEPPIPRKLWINKYSEWDNELGLCEKKDNLSFFCERIDAHGMENVYDRLIEGIAKWREAFVSGYYMHIEKIEKNYIHVVRKFETEEHFHLFGVKALIYLAIHSCHTLEEIAEMTDLSITIIKPILDQLLKEKIAIFLDGKYLALASSDSQYRWTKGNDQVLRFEINGPYYMPPDIVEDIVSVSPICGCEGGCGYCYISERSLSKRYENHFSLNQTMDFIRSASDYRNSIDGQFIIVGGWGEIFPKDAVIRNISVSWISELLKQANPVVLVSKGMIPEVDVEKLTRAAQYPEQLYLLETVTTLNKCREIEPGCIDSIERIRFFKQWKSKGLPGTLLVNPFLPGITDKEFEQILDLLAEMGEKDVIVSPLFLSDSITSKMKNYPAFDDIWKNYMKDLHNSKKRMSDKTYSIKVRALETEESFQIISDRANQKGIIAFRHYSCVLCRQYRRKNKVFFNKIGYCIQCGNCKKIDDQVIRYE